MKLLFIKPVSLSALILALLMFSACNSEEKHDEVDTHADEVEVHAEEVELTQKEIAEFGIELDKASSGAIQIHVTLPGEIIIPPDNLAHIHPRFSGIVKRVYKHIGDTIKKGETLAIIEGNESLVEYEVQSLIDGVIIEKHLTPGEVVEDADHGFVIADISTVWAQLSLYQKDLPYVKKNQSVRLSAGANMPELTARIDYISPIIDEATRTATARVIVPNISHEWKPGLFVNAEIVSENRLVPIAIPKTSIEHFEGNEVVFVYDGDGFSPREITLGLSNHTMVEVLSGLDSGETYVSKGGFTIKAELQKSEMGEGHGH
jgi:cobalt-zinc-cadmium efflux system membrane fusion protein